MSGVKIRGFGRLSNEMRSHAQRLEVGVQAVADTWGQQIQAEAQTNRRWQDRTGNARIGLRSYVDAKRGDGVTVYLTTQVVYGVQLELGHGGRYAIVMPTINANLPELREAIRELVR